MKNIPSDQTIDLAVDVLTEARILDRRISTEDGVADVWARIFDGQPVWPDEALEAVHIHYRQPNAFPIMPGDVLAHCAKQPVWSSPEHASAFLDRWARYPLADAIEEFSGIPTPEYDVPEDIPLSQQRIKRSEQHVRWVDANRDRLIAAILDRRHSPQER